jgi:hypothetical protein
MLVLFLLVVFDFEVKDPRPTILNSLYFKEYYLCKIFFAKSYYIIYEFTSQFN